MGIKRKVLNMLPKGAQNRAEGLTWAREASRGHAVGETIANGDVIPASGIAPDNPLAAYFRAHREGKGLWKWNHYFEIYHRHFAKFVGRPVRVLEIGIYSGGSLEMWRHYFGEGCHICGLDIVPACKAYASEHIEVFIGDQGDRAFWKKFRDQTEPFDIIIDDGGHTPEQQRVTLEETFGHLRPGGVYLCEDIHGIQNRFVGFVAGFASNLYAGDPVYHPEEPERAAVHAATPFQRSTHSIHLYPYVMVLEKNDFAVPEFACPKHGTQWLPLGG